MQKNIVTVLKVVLKELNIVVDEINFEYPQDIAHGDLSTNIALQFGKKAGYNPLQLAEKIAQRMQEKGIQNVERITVANPGFINFYFSRNFYTKNTIDILCKHENFGRNERFLGQRIMVEYTDPNPFKVFHIGHLMPNIIGECIARLYESAGASVARVNYQSDVGLHVAKAMWGILQTLDKMPNESASLREKITYLGQTYTDGARAYESDDVAHKDIVQLNKKIYFRLDDHINKLYDIGRKWSLDHFEEIYKKLGTKFDFYFFESNVSELAKQIIAEFLLKGVFEQSEGAVIFRGEKYGLHTRVFLNKQGLPTYEAKELALAQEKSKIFDYDISFIVAGKEIQEYFAVLLKAMSFVFPKLAKKTSFIGHGMLRLQQGKMSSRKGNIIAGEYIISQVIKIARTKILNDKDIDNVQAQDIAEAVGMGALKYSILKQRLGRDIVYDQDKFFSMQGDSGPYLQYTAVRAKSVIEKAKFENIIPNINMEQIPQDNNTRDIERYLYKFEEVLARSLDEKEPHIMVNYLSELSSVFNSFYSGQKIIDKKDPFSSYKLGVTTAVFIILKNGLNILGIAVPEKM